MSAAQEGLIIVLNATELRSDAILLMEVEVKSITLSHLSYDSMLKYCSTNTDDNEIKREFMVWLWKAAVQPVLREVGFYTAHKDIAGQHPLPQIWWIGVGLGYNEIGKDVV